MMKLTIILSSMLFMLIGCAAKKLVIRNADTMIEYAVQKKIPFSGKQKRQFSKDLGQLLNEKKTTAREVLLPLIDKIDLSSNEAVERDYLQLSGLYQQIVLDFNAIVTKQMAQLDNSQQQTLFSNLEKENQQMQKKDTKDRNKDFNDRFNYFFGTITSEQKNIFESYQDYFDKRLLERLEHRQQLETRMKEIYTEGASAQAFQDAFKQFQQNRLDDKTNLAIIKKFRPTLNVEQIKHFTEKKPELRELINYYIQTKY